METHFSQRQLADQGVAEAEAILRRCVHCGLCTATCPTYLLLGDERDSPRGRIYLIKDMLEKERTPTPEIRQHIDRCLSCMSCMTTCPSGVDYLHLVDFARAYIERKSSRAPKDRLLRRVLRSILPYPSRFRLAIAIAGRVGLFQGVLRRLGLRQIAAMLAVAAKTKPQESALKGASLLPPLTPERRARVAVLRGCVQPVLRPQINDAAIRLLRSRGVEVVLPEGEGCCGAISHHMGHDEEARSHARLNIAAWERVMQAAPLDAILVTASGCGTEMKDYGHLFAGDPAYAERAARIAALVMDVTEFLADRIGLGAPVGWSDIRVAYHSACSMQHAQRINEQPRRLLREAGFTVVEIPEGHICCGSAGTYNILQPEIATELRARKVANIASVRPDCVATGNLGCMGHIAGPDAPPVIHTVELLNWAYGGVCPPEIVHLRDRVRSMQGAFGEQTLMHA